MGAGIFLVGKGKIAVLSPSDPEVLFPDISSPLGRQYAAVPCYESLLPFKIAWIPCHRNFETQIPMPLGKIAIKSIRYTSSGNVALES